LDSLPPQPDAICGNLPTTDIWKRTAATRTEPTLRNPEITQKQVRFRPPQANRRTALISTYIPRKHFYRKSEKKVGKFPKVFLTLPKKVKIKHLHPSYRIQTTEAKGQR
jgi:hypothetical protein